MKKNYSKRSSNAYCKKMYWLAAIFMLFVSIANAQFTGAYDLSNWALTNNNPSSDASVNLSGAPNSFIFTGSNSGSFSVGAYDDFGITVPSTTTLNFDYNFSNPDIEQFYYVINGTATFVTYIGSGNLSVPVTAGDTFAFRINNDDDCCGAGVLTISNFSAGSCSMTASIDSQTNVSCNGGSNGYLSVTPTDGTAPYTYLWDDGSSQIATTPVISGLTAGTYEVTVTDDNGCTATASATITEPSSTLSANGVATDVSCNGGNNGTVDLTVVGGTAPYSYAWSNGATTEDMIGLMAGNYSVTVTDANGCTATETVDVFEPAILEANGVATNVSCNGGNDGAIDLTVTGGNPPYTYAWNNTATTEDLSGLIASTYTVTVTDSKGCTATETVDVFEPAILEANGVTTNVSCNGGNDGAIDLTVTGGNPPYTYAWNNTATTEDLSGLTAATYNVTVTDANGCTATETVDVLEPTILEANGIATNVSCNGGNDGTIDLTVVGGTAPYSYAWSNGATTEDMIGLMAGNYSVTVTDANGCTATTSVEVTEPTVLSVSGLETDVSCNGGSNGAIDLTVTGGTAPYTFAWSNTATTEDLSGLEANTYNVTVTDSKGCTATESVEIQQPAVLSASGVATDVSCNGGNDGTIDLTVVGGTPPYTFAWSNTATTEDLSGLEANTYNVTVTDSKGCTATESVEIQQPAMLSASGVATDVSCNGGNNGTIDLSVVGGTPPYTFAWSNTATTEDLSGLEANTYNVTVTDANGCTTTESIEVTEPTLLIASAIATNVSCNGGNNGTVDLTVTGGIAPYTFTWSNTATTEDLSGLSAGTYEVSVTDANGCTTTESIEVTEPTLLITSATVTNVSCNGGNNGTIDLTVTGGTAPYTFAWSNTATTEDLSGLEAGTYDVTVTDANGCTATTSAAVTEPTILSVNGTETNVSCNGGNNGAIDLTVTGGTAPYTYSWSNTATTEDLSGLEAGTYDVTVTDANGCTATTSVEVTEPTVLSANGLETNVSCNGGNNGAIDLSVTGGTTPYTYAWSNTATTEDLSGLEAGTYNVTVTDANGCTATESVTIIVADDEAPVVICQDITISLDDTGNANITASDIDNGSTDNCAIDSYEIDTESFDCTMVGMNMVTLTITDASGNSSTCTTTVTVEDNEAPMAMCQDITVSLDDTGNASITASDIDNGSTDNCAIDSYEIDIESFDCTMVGINIITLTVTDTNGNSSTCTSTVTVEDNELPSISCEAITVSLDESGNISILPEDLLTDSADNCAIENLSLDIDTFDCEDVGNAVDVTIFAQDASGNMTSCSTTVTVIDDLDPVFTCLADQTVIGNVEDSYYMVPDFVANGEVSAVDNCDGEMITISQTPPAGSLLEEGEYDFTFVTTDQNGNTAVCISTITVETGDLSVKTPEVSLKSVDLYPNPAEDFIIIDNPQHLQLKEMVIYDLNGRKVLTLDLENYTDNTQLNISKLEAAQYFAMIKSTNNGVVVKRILRK